MSDFFDPSLRCLVVLRMWKMAKEDSSLVIAL